MLPPMFIIQLQTSNELQLEQMKYNNLIENLPHIDTSTLFSKNRCGRN